MLDRADTIAQWIDNDTLPELKGVHRGLAITDAWDLSVARAVYLGEMELAQDMVTMYADIVLLRVTC
jgi:hypothetical protein